MHRSTFGLLRLFPVLALLVAMAALGFGHRVAASDAAVQAHLSAFGTLDDLCNDSDSPHRPCPACTLAHGAVLPDVAEAAAPVVFAERSGTPQVAIRRLAARPDHSRMGRAPPPSPIA